MMDWLWIVMLILTNPLSLILYGLTTTAVKGEDDE